MKHVMTGVLLSLALAGCGQEAEFKNSYDGEVQAIMPAPPVAEMRRAEFDDGAFDVAPAEPSPDNVPSAETAQFIAYTYNLGMSLPRAGVEPTMQAHVAACEAAGPRICIITNSNVNNQSDDYASAYLSLRAAPAWIETFLGGLDAEVKAADGEVTSRNKQSVDLTSVILDTDARLNAKITLKGRLEDLLATREGDLGELLQVERELARVTGEIESITSNLKALRLRVSMSEMTLGYETKRSLVSGGRSNPLASAFGDFFYNMSAALASVITFFAVGLPWMVLAGVFLFIWLRAIWPRIRKPKKA